MKRFFYPSLLAVCFAVGAAASVIGAQPTKPSPLQRVLRAVIPARAVRSIVLRAGDGKVRIASANGDVVRALVKVYPKPPSERDVVESVRKWFLTSAYRTDGEFVQAIRIESRSEGGQLELGLTPSASSRRRRIKEEWTLEVPSRAALVLSLREADLDVSGVAGGVNVELGAGQADLDIPAGDVAVEVAVGSAKVRTASDSIRQVRLTSAVGRTSLWRHGARVRYGDPPGAGSEISVEGQGRYSIRIDVSVGDAELRIR
jgi:hypothetical protein